MHLKVALVASLIFNSVSFVPSHLAAFGRSDNVATIDERTRYSFEVVSFSTLIKPRGIIRMGVSHFCSRVNDAILVIIGSCKVFLLRNFVAFLRRPCQRMSCCTSIAKCLFPNMFFAGISCTFFVRRIVWFGF